MSEGRGLSAWGWAGEMLISWEEYSMPICRGS